jgi:VWFA-related protein
MILNAKRTKLFIGFWFILFLQISYSKDGKPQFKVEVNVVSLDVQVLDPQGLPVKDLHKEDFSIVENGAPVEINTFTEHSDVSVSLVFALGTAHMPQANLSLAKDAISQIIHLLNPRDELSLYSYNQKDVYIEQEFTRDRPKIINALENIGVSSRIKRPGRFIASFAPPPQTGLGLDAGLAAAKKGMHQRKALILFRERIDSLGPASLEHARETGCMLISLGFSDDARNRLSLISDQSGEDQMILDASAGRSSNERGNVTQLCRTIASLLLSRYSITYYTSIREDKRPRKIEILMPGRRDFRILAQRSFPSPR